MNDVTSRIYDKDGTPWPSWKLSPPPEGASGVGPWCWQFYETCRRHRDKQGLPQLWVHFHELFRGRIFKHRSQWSKIVANLFFKNINSLKNNITDNKPRADISSTGETGQEIAAAWQKRYDTWWDSRRQQDNLSASVFRSELMGYQCDQMIYNPDLEGGTGEIETKRWDTFSVCFYPGHIDVQTQPGMVVFKALEIGEIIDLWPEAEGQVKPDAEYSELLAEGRQWVRGNRNNDLRPMGYAASYVVPEGDGQQTPGDSRYGIQRALVIWVWVKDFTMIWVDPRTGEQVKSQKPIETGQMVPVVDPETGQPVVNPDTGEIFVQPEIIQPEQWSKYPGFIRCVAITNKGNLVLSDDLNPSINPNLPRQVACNCYLWDKFPFIKRLSISDDMSEFGLSIVEQIESLVIEICKKLTQYGAHLGGLCRNPLILPKGCGVDRNQVNNLINRVWEPVAGLAAQIKYLDVPPAPTDIITFLELCIRLVDMITGITDVSEGRKPQGIEAARAIAALQEKAQTVFRDKIRHNDTYLEEQGRMFISLGQNWYTETQLLEYEGKSGQMEQVNFRGVDFQGELSFHIEAGSTLPHNRAVRQGQVIELAKARNLPNRILLEELGFADAKKLAQEMDAGPLQAALQKLKQSGLFEDDVLQAIEQLLSMDEATYRKNFGSGNPMDVASEV